MNIGDIWIIVFCLSIACTIACTILVVLGFARRGKKERELIEKAIKHVSAEPAWKGGDTSTYIYTSARSDAASSGTAERIGSTGTPSVTYEHKTDFEKQPAKPSFSPNGNAARNVYSQPTRAAYEQPLVQNQYNGGTQSGFCPQCGTKIEGRF